jgi:sugar O-acyltransferase (sialic acid O-acetyltransferase NeuD family)
MFSIWTVALSNHSQSTRPLFIIGAGGFGKTVASLAKTDDASGRDWVVKGFLDNRSGLSSPSDLPVIGDPLTYKSNQAEVFICALGDPQMKRRYSANLIKQGGTFISLLPEAAIGDRAKISRGCIFERKIGIGTDTFIDEFVTILSMTIIGYGVRIGQFCQIGSFVFIGGNVSIGNDVTIHPHSTIAPGISVGSGAVIGAGSVVLRDVPANTTVFGNPARVVFVRG